QKPVVLVPLTLHADERESPLELFPVQCEVQPAGGDTLRDRDAGLHRLIGAVIPDRDSPGPVGAGWNGPLETGVGERMILDVDRQTLDGRVHARLFRHGPALEYAVRFQTKVVV